MTDQSDLFKASELKPKKRKFYKYIPPANYCIFDEFKASEQWRELNVTEDEEKMLRSMIVEGKPNEEDWEVLLKVNRKES